MRAFVTGGSGFIGRYLVRALVKAGHDVVGLARSDASAAIMAQDGATAALGDVLDVASLRVAMTDCDAVFHLAAWSALGGDNWLQAENVNVNGTRNVLQTAFDLDIPRIIYVSSVNVFGDTKGVMVDETYEPPAGPFLSEVDRTKWLAHYKVAVPLIEQGAPITIVMPGGVYGPGDSSLTGDLMRLFSRGEMPLLAGPEMTITWAHVADIAQGILLAAEKGEVGETYVLAGPAIPLGEMVDFWSYLTGKPGPMAKVPARFVQSFAPVINALEDQLTLPEMATGEALRAMGATYMARADKARRELGWRSRPPQAGMLETFDWLASEYGTSAKADDRERLAAQIALAAALLVFLLWLLGRKRND